MQTAKSEALLIKNIFSPEQITQVNTNWSLLAAIRFFLAMIVLFSHWGGYTDFSPLVHHGKSLVNFAHYLGSFAAVIAFFMISGYSIAHSITKKPEKFLLRRIWRIWPTYFFCYFAFVLPLAIKHNASTGQIIGNAFMMQGYFTTAINANIVSWSLAIEEGLYLLSPIFRRTPNVILLIIIGISGDLYAHSPFLNWTRYAGEAGGHGFICCAWAWLLGFLYYRNFNKSWSKCLLLFLPVLLMGVYNQLPGTIQCALVLGVALALIYSPHIKISSPVVNKFLTWLGNISYQVYICHGSFSACLLMILTYFGYTEDKWNQHPYRVVFLVLIVSAAIYHFIDAPNRKRWTSPLFSFSVWKNRFSHPWKSKVRLIDKI